jgi:FKBP-type peptidyl-prolyl cis-trans isomerase FklB
MKLRNVILSALAVATLSACQTGGGSSKLETLSDSVSYAMGAGDGQQLITSFKRNGIDSLVNVDLYLKTLQEVSEGTPSSINFEENKDMLQNFFREFQTDMMRAAQDSTYVKSFNPSASRVDSVSILMGASDAENLKKGLAQRGMDSILNVGLYVKTIVAAAKEQELLIDPQEYQATVQKFFSDIEEKELMAKHGENKKAGEEFLAINKGKEGVTTTASGLQYEVIKEGNGNKPGYTDKVNVTYKGTLIDGTEFDAGTTSFGVNQVIPGWTEALQLMSVGAKYKLFIPQEIAYGKRAAGSIPPFSTLVFEVELHSIDK